MYKEISFGTLHINDCCLAFLAELYVPSFNIIGHASKILAQRACHMMCYTVPTWFNKTRPAHKNMYTGRRKLSSAPCPGSEEQNFQIRSAITSHLLNGLGADGYPNYLDVYNGGYEKC